MYKEVKEPFNAKHKTYIIAFCPDMNSFFVTNERHFFWESDQDFDSEESAIDYFESHVHEFTSIASKIRNTKKSLAQKYRQMVCLTQGRSK